MCRNRDTLLMRANIMTKTETVHTRVTHDIKEQAEAIFTRIGLTTSQAIMLFLTATVNNNGLPFELVLPSTEEHDIAFATSLTTVDGVIPSEHATKIMRFSFCDSMDS